MFDYVDYKATCSCGVELENFQSKDGPCELKTLEPHEVGIFYAVCDKCDTWHEWEVDVEVIVTKLDIRKTKEEKLGRNTTWKYVKTDE